VARRRGTPDTYTFDLLSEDEIDAEVPRPDEGEPTPSWTGRALARLRAATPHQRVVAAGAALGTVLAVGGGVAITSAVASHQTAERLRASPGGVVSLEGAISERWTLELDGGVLAVLPDGGLLVGMGPAAVAVDVADGAERWRHDLGEDLDCGPAPRLEVPAEWIVPSDVVVCVAGPDDERTVTVLEADGAVVGQRVLDATYAGEDTLVEPGPDGSLAVLERPGPMPARIEAPADRDGLVWSQLDEGWVAGADARLRIEDALTGEVRTELEAPFEPVTALWACGALMEQSDRIVVEFTRGELVASPVLVEHSHCGIDVAVTREGVELETVGGVDGMGPGWFGGTTRLPYPDGGVILPGGGAGARLVDDQGATVLDAEGSILAPAATDGTGSDVVLVDGQGVIVAHGADGGERWRSEVRVAQVIARAGGMAVVGGYEELVAIDLATGVERWRSDALFVGPDGSPSRASVMSAVTDGRRLLLTLRGEDGITRMASVDLLTGEAAPGEVVGDTFALLTAVDGHPVVNSVRVDAAGGRYVLVVTAVSGLGPQ
jgi:hypothetical protein